MQSHFDPCLEVQFCFFRWEEPAVEHSLPPENGAWGGTAGSLRLCPSRLVLPVFILFQCCRSGTEIRDPVPFVDPWIRDGLKIMIQIQYVQPWSYFRELRNHFLGLKYLNSLMRIRDSGWKKFGFTYPGSATLYIHYQHAKKSESSIVTNTNQETRDNCVSVKYCNLQ